MDSKIRAERMDSVPTADVSLFDMLLNSPMDDLDVELLKRPDMWEHVSLLKVLHDVYHVPEELSFPENERPHWRFVNRLSEELCKLFELKTKEIVKKEAEIAKKQVEMELWRTRFFHLYHDTSHFLNANGVSAHNYNSLHEHSAFQQELTVSLHNSESLLSTSSMDSDITTLSESSRSHILTQNSVHAAHGQSRDSIPCDDVLSQRGTCGH
jgi:hypothetical protein